MTLIRSLLALILTALTLTAIASNPLINEPQTPTDGRIYKCVTYPDGSYYCARVAGQGAIDIAEVVAAQQAAATGAPTLVLTAGGDPADINYHGHSANCHVIGRYGNTTYIECG